MSACKRLRAAGAVGDVETEHAAAAAGGGDVGQRGLGAGLVGTVVHDNVEAVTRQAPRDGAADALAGAGDEDRAGHELAGLLISLVTSCGW